MPTRCESALVERSRRKTGGRGGTLSTRISVACVFTLTVIGCASPEASRQEKDAALNSLNVCIYNNIHKLDDGRSDATSIALGLKGLCGAQFAHSRDVFAESLNPEAARMFHADDDAAFLQFATTAVLEERAQKHQ